MLISLALASCTTQPTKNTSYSINVNIDGLEEGIVYLQKVIDNKLTKIDSADAKGVIEFKGTIEYPEIYYFAIKDKRGNIPVFVDAANISVTGHIDSLRQLKISGSPAQDELNAFNESTKSFDEERMALIDKYRTASKENNEDLVKQIIEKVDAVQEQKNDFIYKYVLENKASIVAAQLAMQNNYYFELEQMETIATGFDPSIEQSPIVKDFKERVATLQAVAIGKKYLDFTMNNTEDVPVKFSSLLKGGYTLVDFWAAWCGPCRGENPNVVAVYNDYKDKGFDVIGISLDKEKADWLKAIEDDKLTWDHVSDLQYWDNSAAKLYGVKGIPHSILLDKDGIIIAKNLRGEELRNKIAELLD